MSIDGNHPSWRVRRGFLAWAIPVSILLSAYLIFWAWDYVEGRRLKRAIDAVVASGAPINLATVGRDEDQRQSTAAPYYLAAAALSSTIRVPLNPAGVQGTSSLTAIDEPARGIGTTWLEDSQSIRVFDLLDRATSSTFRGFPPGTEYSYRGSNLLRLLKVAQRRTESLASLGRDQAAAESLVTELTLYGARRRPLPATADLQRGWRPSLDNLQTILDRRAGDDRAVVTIASLLAESDGDDLLARELEDQRAGGMESTVRQLSLWPTYGGISVSSQPGGKRLLARPLVARQLRRRLDMYHQLIAAAREPWPARIDALDAVSYEAIGGPASNVGQFRRAIMEIANVRAARTAVAVARFRRDHKEVWPASLLDLVPVYLDKTPINPFSGEALRFVRRGAGAVVYTIGPDRKDDAGPMDDNLRPTAPVSGDLFVGDSGFRLR